MSSAHAPHYGAASTAGGRPRAPLSTRRVAISILHEREQWRRSLLSEGGGKRICRQSQSKYPHGLSDVARPVRQRKSAARCARAPIDVSCQSRTPGITTTGFGPSEDNYVEIAQTIPDPRASRLVGSGGRLLRPRPEARGASSGSTPGVRHSAAGWARGIAGYLCPGEKLVEVEFSSEELAQAAGNWRSAMAPRL